LNIMSALAAILHGRSGQPGKTSESISNRLLLICLYVQGAGFTERLISEGQYVKAAAVLKQDFEFLARIREFAKGTAKYGKVPNAKSAPEGSQRFYGELNDVAHPSKANLLKTLVSDYVAGDVNGVSPIPGFKRETARALYELHIFLSFEIAREA